MIKGAKGKPVKDLQIALNRLGFNLDTDGDFGPKTEAAVNAFKKQHKLPADGIAGPRTLAALKKAKPRKNKDILRIRAWKVAESLLYVHETYANNRGPKVDEIIHANGGAPGEPWCGDFMAYCYRHAGSKAVGRLWCSVAALGYIGGLVTVRNPKKGDLVRYNFSHVGMFIKDNGNGTIHTIEGNTGPGYGGVYHRDRPKSLVTNYKRVLR